jgi:hypothetical protein
MQEMVLNAHLAYLAKRTYVPPFNTTFASHAPGPYAYPSVRVHSHNFVSSPPSGSYVFENYTWDKTSDDFSNYNGKPIPARVPLTALLSGITLLPRILLALHFHSRIQAQFLEIPFHHPRTCHPRLFPSSSIKYALTAL